MSGAAKPSPFVLFYWIHFYSHNLKQMRCETRLLCTNKKQRGVNQAAGVASRTASHYTTFLLATTCLLSAARGDKTRGNVQLIASSQPDIYSNLSLAGTAPHSCSVAGRTYSREIPLSRHRVTACAPKECCQKKKNRKWKMKNEKG